MAVVAGTVAAAAGAVTYVLARPFFKVKVNCHFCNLDSKVPYAETNNWTCSVCDQYNGFQEDGDYNKPVHHIQSIANTFVNNLRTQKVAENGLCKACNLNQELKIKQLASFTGDGEEQEEYRLHLERVYRLCAGCEEILASKLKEQDNKLAPGIIEHRLETSRLSAHHEPSRISPLLHYLLDSQVVLAVLLFFVLLNPTLSKEYSNALPLQLETWLGVISSFIQDHSYLIQGFTGLALGLISLVVLRVKPISVLGILPVISFLLNLNHEIQLTVACISGTLILLVPAAPPRATKPANRRPIVDTLSSRFIEAETLTDSGDGGSNTSHSESNPVTKLMSRSPSFLFQSTANLLSPGRMSSPLLRSGDTTSLNHEFVTENDREYDLASLTLGAEEEFRPASINSSHFSPRLYTSENTSGIKFSPVRPVLRPSRLTSWVAGGYWTPPTTGVFGEPISRSSSQSSGFVSASVVPSLQNFPLHSPPPHNFASLPSSPVNSIYGDCDRFSVLSEPLMRVGPNHTGLTQLRQEKYIQRRRSTLDEDMSDTSMDRGSQVRMRRSQRIADSSPTPGDNPPGSTPVKERSAYDRMSLTITITPVGILLGASLAVNLAVLVYMFR
jgi:hypothetical protein